MDTTELNNTISLFNEATEGKLFGYTGNKRTKN
jgi:hypothetical protein